MTEEYQITEELEHLAQCFDAQQLEFIRLFLKGVPIVDAWQNAGLSRTGNDRAKDKVAAKEFRRRGDTQAYINALQRVVATNSIMTLEARKKRLSDIAMANVTDIVKVGEVVFPDTGEGGTGIPVQMVTIRDMDELTDAQKAAIKSIKPKPGGLEIELYDQFRAMDMLAKLEGEYTEKKEVSMSGQVQTIAYIGDNRRGPKEP